MFLAKPRLDEAGFLKNAEEWQPEIALSLAEKEGITLTKDHWQLIYFLRQFYEEFQLHPSMRVLIQQLRKDWPAEKASSLYLLELFPGGPIKQASKIAGLPKPLKCL